MHANGGQANRPSNSGLDRARSVAARARDLRSPLRLQRGVNAIDQALRRTRFGQKADGAGCECVPPDALFRKGGHENDGASMSFGNQSSLQFDAVNVRHPYVRERAREFVHPSGIEKVRGGRIRCGHVTK